MTIAAQYPVPAPQFSRAWTVEERMAMLPTAAMADFVRNMRACG
jgi:hypothetical protein